MKLFKKDHYERLFGIKRQLEDEWKMAPVTKLPIIFHKSAYEDFTKELIKEVNKTRNDK